MIKNYLLDTNILLQSPNSIYGFDDNVVWICGTTLQELDHKKTAPGEIGYSARECARIMDELRQQGNLVNGVDLPNGGRLIVEPDGVSKEYLPDGFDLSVPDNRIISSCIHINKRNEGFDRQRNGAASGEVILVTNDISMRINASVCGVKVEGYRNDHISSSENELYRGYQTIDNMPEECIKQIKDDGVTTIGDIEVLSGQKMEFLENEYAIINSKKYGKILAVHRDGGLFPVKATRVFGNIEAKNEIQEFALDALTAPAEEIPLVILLGPAGTSKTFLSLAAGLAQTNLGYMDDGSVYRKILISKPNVETAEKSFGYLPGDLRSKTNSLLSNYYDNLETILLGDSGEDPKEIKMQIDDYMDNGVIEICPLSYIRGRSLKDCYIICDEAQNAGRSLIRDIVTRAGTGSKVVLAGDIAQVDAPSLDRRNNGLLYCMEHMKGNKLAAVIRFDESHCVRSPLAEAAIKNMVW